MKHETENAKNYRDALIASQFQVGDKVACISIRTSHWSPATKTLNSVDLEETVGEIVDIKNGCALVHNPGASYPLQTFHISQVKLIDRPKPEPKYVKVTMYQPVRTDGEVDVLSPKVYPTPDEALNSPASNMRDTIGYAPIEVFVREDAP
jgi:hypothetical protein